MAGKGANYYRVKSSYALLFPDSIQNDYRVWAKPFTVVAVDHHVLQGWIDTQLHKVDKISAREAKKLIADGAAHWNGQSSLHGLARSLFNKLTAFQPIDPLVELAADIDEGVPDVDDVPAPEPLPDDEEDEPKPSKGRKGGRS